MTVRPYGFQHPRGRRSITGAACFSASGSAVHGTRGQGDVLICPIGIYSLLNPSAAGWIPSRPVRKWLIVIQFQYAGVIPFRPGRGTRSRANRHFPHRPGRRLKPQVPYIQCFKPDLPQRVRIHEPQTTAGTHQDVPFPCG